MRIAPVVVVLLTALSIPACASSADSKIPDDQMITALEQRAAQAQPREQCFLYAQLVHDMVEFSARQYQAGDVEKANGLLKRAQEFTHKITSVLAVNDKKLKDAQILLRHAALRLSDLLHAGGSDDDAEVVKQTLSQLNKAQDQAMLQVFKK
jgi:hypothetical protein